MKSREATSLEHGATVLRGASWVLALGLAASAPSFACAAQDEGPGDVGGDGGGGGPAADAGRRPGADGGSTDAGAGPDAVATSMDGGARSHDAASDARPLDAAPDAVTHDAGSPPDASTTGAHPAGWLYTVGNKIKVSDGAGGGSPWMGRGVNVDDIFLCGYDNSLWMPNPDQTLITMFSGLVSAWKPNFVRISLGMASYPTVTSWVTNPAQYKTPMTNVIDALGANPNLYVLVTLRSDASMIGQDTVDGDPEATGLPSDSTTTPNATAFPTGTDATYVALVDTFASSKFVLFGLTNEPGGNKLSNAKISAAMSHAVGVIRAEEDRLGVPHHIVSVQGNGWTSDISFYAAAPLPYDNVVYEVHGYPPPASSYTYANIPVIIGEYGSLANATSFFADVEAKQIPNLAWDFDPYSNCTPDLLTVNQSATNLVPSAWGSTVQSYLLAHPH